MQTLIRSILGTFLGKYFEDSNRLQMAFDFYNGAVTIKNLKLKLSSLLELELPVDLQSCNIGELKIKFSLFSFISSPIRVEANNVLINSKSRRFEERSEEELLRDIEELKRKFLSKWEKDYLAFMNHEIGENIESKASQIMQKITISIENLELKIEFRDFVLKLESDLVNVKPISASSQTEQNVIRKTIKLLQTTVSVVDSKKEKSEAILIALRLKMRVGITKNAFIGHFQSPDINCSLEAPQILFSLNPKSAAILMFVLEYFIMYLDKDGEVQEASDCKTKVEAARSFQSIKDIDSSEKNPQKTEKSDKQEGLEEFQREESDYIDHYLRQFEEASSENFDSSSEAIIEEIEKKYPVETILAFRKKAFETFIIFTEGKRALRRKRILTQYLSFKTGQKKTLCRDLSQEEKIRVRKSVLESGLSRKPDFFGYPNIFEKIKFEGSIAVKLLITDGKDSSISLDSDLDITLSKKIDSMDLKLEMKRVTGNKTVGTIKNGTFIKFQNTEPSPVELIILATETPFKTTKYSLKVTRADIFVSDNLLLLFHRFLNTMDFNSHSLRKNGEIAFEKSEKKYEITSETITDISIEPLTLIVSPDEPQIPEKDEFLFALSLGTISVSSDKAILGANGFLEGFDLPKRHDLDKVDEKLVQKTLVSVRNVNLMDMTNFLSCFKSKEGFEFQLAKTDRTNFLKLENRAIEVNLRANENQKLAGLLYLIKKFLKTASKEKIPVPTAKNTPWTNLFVAVSFSNLRALLDNGDKTSQLEIPSLKAKYNEFEEESKGSLTGKNINFFNITKELINLNFIYAESKSDNKRTLMIKAEDMEIEIDQKAILEKIDFFQTNLGHFKTLSENERPDDGREKMGEKADYYDGQISDSIVMIDFRGIDLKLMYNGDVFGQVSAKKGSINCFIGNYVSVEVAIDIFLEENKKTVLESELCYQYTDSTRISNSKDSSKSIVIRHNIANKNETEIKISNVALNFKMLTLDRFLKYIKSGPIARSYCKSGPNFTKNSENARKTKPETILKASDLKQKKQEKEENPNKNGNKGRIKLIVSDSRVLLPINSKVPEGCCLKIARAEISSLTEEAVRSDKSLGFVRDFGYLDSQERDLSFFEARKVVFGDEGNSEEVKGIEMPLVFFDGDANRIGGRLKTLDEQFGYEKLLLFLKFFFYNLKENSEDMEEEIEYERILATRNPAEERQIDIRVSAASLGVRQIATKESLTKLSLSNARIYVGISSDIVFKLLGDSFILKEDSTKLGIFNGFLIQFQSFEKGKRSSTVIRSSGSKIFVHPGLARYKTVNKIVETMPPSEEKNPFSLDLRLENATAFVAAEREVGMCKNEGSGGEPNSESFSKNAQNLKTFKVHFDLSYYLEDSDTVWATNVVISKLVASEGLIDGFGSQRWFLPVLKCEFFAVEFILRDSFTPVELSIGVFSPSIKSAKLHERSVANALEIMRAFGFLKIVEEGSAKGVEPDGQIGQSRTKGRGKGGNFQQNIFKQDHLDYRLDPIFEEKFGDAYVHFDTNMLKLSFLHTADYNAHGNKLRLVYPVLRIRCCKLYYIYQSFMNQRSFCLNSVISADYFNYKLKKKEPLVEPLPFAFKLVDSEGIKKYSLKTEKFLNINVTNQMVRQVRHCLETLNRVSTEISMSNSNAGKDPKTGEEDKCAGIGRTNENPEAKNFLRYKEVFLRVKNDTEFDFEMVGKNSKLLIKANSKEIFSADGKTFREVELIIDNQADLAIKNVKTDTPTTKMQYIIPKNFVRQRVLCIQSETSTAGGSSKTQRCAKRFPEHSSRKKEPKETVKKITNDVIRGAKRGLKKGVEFTKIPLNKLKNGPSRDDHCVPLSTGGKNTVSRSFYRQMKPKSEVDETEEVSGGKELENSFLAIVDSRLSENESILHIHSDVRVSNTTSVPLDFIEFKVPSGEEKWVPFLFTMKDYFLFRPSVKDGYIDNPYTFCSKRIPVGGTKPGLSGRTIQLQRQRRF